MSRKACKLALKKALATADAQVTSTLFQLNQASPQGYRHKSFFNRNWSKDQVIGFPYLHDFVKAVEGRFGSEDYELAREHREMSLKLLAMDAKIAALEAEFKRADDEVQAYYRTHSPPRGKSPLLDSLREKRRKARRAAFEARREQILLGVSTGDLDRKLGNLIYRLQHEMTENYPVLMPKTQERVTFSIDLRGMKDRERDGPSPKLVVCTAPIAGTRHAPETTFYACARLDLLEGTLGYRIKLGFPSRTAPTLMEFSEEELQSALKPKKPSAFKTRLKEAFRKRAIDAIPAECRPPEPGPEPAGA